jgi:hypothetical protein
MNFTPWEYWAPDRQLTAYTQEIVAILESVLVGYYPHNIHFLFAVAQMEGSSQIALKAARKLVTSVPDKAYQELPQLEEFRPMPFYALVRFGKWAEILREPKPAPSSGLQLECGTGPRGWP